MSKGLEALYGLVKNPYYITLGRVQGKKQFATNFKIIETELKRLEEIDKLPKTEFYTTNKIELNNELDRKLKALEIIIRTGLSVDWFVGTFIKQDIGYSGFLICLEEMGNEGHLAKQLMMSEEEFNLLKEALL